MLLGECKAIIQGRGDSLLSQRDSRKMIFEKKQHMLGRSQNSFAISRAIKFGFPRVVRLNAILAPVNLALFRHRDIEVVGAAEDYHYIGLPMRILGQVAAADFYDPVEVDRGINHFNVHAGEAWILAQLLFKKLGYGRIAIDSLCAFDMRACDAGIESRTTQHYH